MRWALLWPNRTVSERTSLVMLAVGCAIIGVLAIWGQDPMDGGDDFTFYLGGLVFGALFLVCAVPAALAMLVLGGAHFNSRWRRGLDKMLPILTLALLFLMLAGL